jgi:CRISPR-associated protein Cmr6
MNIPLYKEIARSELNQRPADAHAGLWFDKFCNRWYLVDWKVVKETDKWELKKKKQSWIETVTGRVGDQRQLEEAVHRVQQLLKVRSGRWIEMKTTSRFVTGLGLSNPVENGFAWHHTLGTAYLPGSSIKGLVRAWATDWESIKKETIDRIFGYEPSTTSPSAESHAGSVIFLDAIPIAPVKLELEIMTPHYVLYYQDPKKYLPHDWYAPIPIPFLTVAEGQTFLFGLMPRTKEGEQDLHMVEEWLKEALKWIGVGAKTAIGYGRFEER